MLNDISLRTSGGCLEDLIQCAYLVKDELSILLVDLEHDLISGITALGLQENGGALLVDCALIPGCRCQLNLPIELGNT